MYIHVEVKKKENVRMYNGVGGEYGTYVYVCMFEVSLVRQLACVEC